MCMNIDSNTRQWRSENSSTGSISAVAFGHLNTDQVPDRIYASSKSQSGDGILTAIDGSTDEILWQTDSSTFGRNAWTGIHDVTIGDINGDNINEVLVATDSLYDGRVYVLDSSSGEVTGTVALENGSPIYSVRIANIDDDADMEILAGGGVEHTGAKGVFVYVIDGPTLTWTKTFPNLGKAWTDLWSMEVVDVDGDDSHEVVALLDQIYIVDPDNNGLRQTTEQFTSLAVSTDIFSGDAIVYVGDISGNLSTLSADATVNSVMNLCDSSIAALETISAIRLAFVCNGALGIYDIVKKSVTWVTETNFDSSLAKHDRLRVEMVKGKIQLFMGGRNGYLFEESIAEEIG